MAESRMMSLEQVDAKILGEIAAVCKIATEQIEDVYTCTGLQIGLMIDSGERDMYKGHMVYTLDPSISLDEYISAISRVVALNAILRTRIVNCASGVLQVVVREEHRTSQPPSEIGQYLLHENLQSLDFGRSLFRTALIGRQLILTAHHAILDGYTIGAFFNDVSLAYHGNLVQPRASFKDFVRHCLDVEDSTAKQFWASRFNGSPSIFPHAGSITSTEPPHFIRKIVPIPGSGTEVSVAVIPTYIEAAWSLTAMDYTSSKSVAFGVVFSARSPSRNAMGPTICTCPVQVTLRNDMSIQEFLKERAQERRVLAGHPALQYGFANIRSVSEAAKIASSFQAVLNIRPKEDRNDEEDLLHVQFQSKHEPRRPFSLTITCFLDETSMMVEAEFDPTVLCPRQMQRVLNQFEHNLQCLILHPPKTKMKQLPRINSQDLQEVLQWNSGIPAIGQEPLHETFRNQAKALIDPTDIAVRAWDGTFSYTDLNFHSEVLAMELRRRGCKTGTAVVFAFPKSVWTVVVVLAIMKAGAACVPIDPQFPKARNQGIISRTNACLMLAYSQDYVAANEFDIPMLVVDSATMSTLPKSEIPFTHTTTSDQVAYIMFTSGSTGAPKGVVLEHGCLASSLRSFGQKIGWERGFRMLQFAAHIWDASILEIFGALMFGGCICIPSEDARLSDLANFIESHKIDFTVLTPTVIRTLSPKDVPSLKCLMSGGEPMTNEILKDWAGELRLLNGWGLCETAVMGAVAEAKLSSRYPLSIGTPTGCAIWITLEGDIAKLAPVGVAGELVVEGPNIARCYLADEAKTAAFFVGPPPWATTRGEKWSQNYRFYRSGDLAAYNADGTIAYLGRCDGQLKIGGQRLEVGEIEQVLLGCDEVEDAVVTSRISSGNQHLTAVVTLAGPSLPRMGVLEEFFDDEQQTAASILRDIKFRAKSDLPKYMVPTSILAVGELPRMASTKLDRKRVKDWLQRKPSSEISETICPDPNLILNPPITAIERQLQTIWSSQLAIKPHAIGRESSFVRLGGDSISGLRVTSQLRQEGVRLTVAALLRSSDLATTAQICTAIQSETAADGSGADWQPPEPLYLDWKSSRTIRERVVATGVPLSNIHSISPCSPVQEGILLAQSKSQGSEYWQRFVLRFEPNIGLRHLDINKLVTAWQKTCKVHSILRTIFVNGLVEGSAFQQLVLVEADPSIQLIACEAEPNLISNLQEHGKPCFDALQPQHRVTFVEAPTGDIVAILDSSHTMMDAAAVKLLCRNWAHEYTRGTSLVGLEFAQYIAWVEANRQTASKYWRTYLRETRPCLLQTLDNDHQSSNQSVTELLEIPFHQASALHDFCAENGATVANLIHLSWGVTLSILTKRSSVCFGYPHSGRDSFDGAEEILGPLVTMLVCKLDIREDLNALNLLSRVKEDAISAQENLALSLSEVYDVLDLGSTPLFNSVLTLQPLSEDDLTPGYDFSTRLLEIDGPTEYPITVAIEYSKTEFHAMLGYQTAQVSKAYAAEIADLFAAVMETIIEDPKQAASTWTSRMIKKIQPPAPFALVDPSAGEDAIRKAARLCEVPKSRIADIYPCTSLQQELFSIRSSSVRQDMAHFVFDLRSEGDGDEWITAWNATRAAIPILRSRIVALSQDRMYQVILKQEQTWSEESDLSEYIEWVNDLSSTLGAPLCRFGRIDQDDGNQHIVMSLHRAIYDDETLDMIFATAQSAFDGTDISKFPTLGGYVQYLLKQNNDSRSYAYWKRRLHGFREASSFPEAALQETPYLPDSKISTTFSSRRPRTENQLTGLLLAAWGLCLSRRTGNSEVCFGLNLSDRFAPVAQLSETPGPITATVPFALKIPHGISCDDLISGASDCANEAALFLHLGLKAIAELDDDTAAVCHFQNTLAVKNRRSDSRPTEGRTIHSLLKSEHQFLSSTVPLHVTCSVELQHIQIDASFDSGTINIQEVELLLQQYKHAITQLDSAETQRISALQDLSVRDIALLETWNAQLPAAIEICVHDRIRELATQQPQAEAACSTSCSLTYAELDGLSDALAARLCRVGVRPGSIVPFVTGRSVATLVIMVGILKAGGAMLPMDVDHPSERLAFILRQANASIVLASLTDPGAIRTAIPDIDVMNVDLLDLKTSSPVERCSCPPTKPSDACYLIFTSGSTGTPKGVVVPHTSIASSATYMARRIPLNAESRTLHIANPIFDAVMFETLATLLAGGCVCIPSATERYHDIEGYMERMQINAAFLTPSMMALLSSLQLPSLHTLIVGGELLTKEIVRTWGNRLCLLNAYGPTETTVFSNLNPNPEVESCKVIGLPVGSRSWIVDPTNHNRLMPIGSVGELMIEGPNVSDGYLNDPQKTNEVFLFSAPLWADVLPNVQLGQRFYKTGDLAWHRHDGSVVYEGRKDHQVKLRGLRIELGEIECQLEYFSEPGWQIVAEMIRPKGRENNPALMAFYAPSTTHDPLENKAFDSLLRQPLSAKAVALRDAISSRLPPYMVPNYYIHIDRIPLTAGGKADRKLLRCLGGTLTLSELASFNPTIPQLPKLKENTRTPPVHASAAEQIGATTRNDGELVMQKLWAKILDIPAENISSGDNWFTLGGNSLRAIRLVGLAREQGVSLTVADIFKQPRLSDLASLVKASARRETEAVITPFSLLRGDAGDAHERAAIICGIEKVQIDDIFPCTPMQEGLLAMSTKHPGDYVAQLRLKLRAGIDVTRFQRAWEDVVTAAPILRTRFIDLPGEGLVQVVHNEQVRWEIHCDPVKCLDAEHLRIMALGDSLNQAGILVDEETGDTWFLWTASHVLYDGWFMPLILETVEKVYWQTEQAHFHPFQHFVEYVLESRSTAGAQYWQRQFAKLTAEPFPALPSPEYQPRPDSYAVYTIKRPGQHPKCFSLSTALRAAWSVVVASNTNQSEAVFGAIVTGRQAAVPGIERIAGPTIANVPLRIVIDRESSVQQLLQAIHNQALGMVRFEQIGLQNIRRLSAEVEKACHFQSLLVVQSSSEDRGGQAESKLFDTSQSLDSQGIGGYKAFSSCALMLMCEEEGQEILLRLTFDSNVIQRLDISKMKAQLQSLLEIIYDPAYQQKTIREMEEACFEHASDTSSAVAAISEERQVQQKGRVLTYPSGAMPCEDIVSSTDDIEETLRSLWSVVLDIPATSIPADGRLDLFGGDSITAMRLSAAAKKAGLRLSVPDILKHQVLSEMASACALQRTSPPKQASKQPSVLDGRYSTLLESLAGQDSTFRSDNIESITHTTDLQAWMLTSGDLGSFSFHNEFFIAPATSLDVKILREACEQVIKCHSILRTVFVQHKSSLCQVVLKLPPIEQVRLGNYRSGEANWSYARYLPQFTLARAENNCTKLCLRIHHALYDAVSIGILLRDLGAAYKGQTLQSKHSFHSWISYAAEDEVSTARSYWQRLLHGSVPSSLHSNNLPQRGEPSDEVVRIQVPMERLNVDCGTPANVFKAAWSLVMMRALGSCDVVFGEINANRSSAFPAVDEVCGPCVNVVPVRARIEDSKTLGSLISYLHEQSISTIPHQHLGFRSIIRENTEWANWTRVSSIVNFQNHRSLNGSIVLGNTDCTLSAGGRSGDITTIWVAATLGEETLNVELLYSSSSVSSEQASWLARNLKTVLLGIPTELEHGARQVQDRMDATQTYTVLASIQHISENHDDETMQRYTSGGQAKRTVLEAWKDVGLLSKGSSEACSAFDADPAADLVSCFLLAEHYRSRGHNISTFDVLKHPNRLAQAQLLEQGLAKATHETARPVVPPLLHQLF